jgi:hypothetical protein
MDSEKVKKEMRRLWVKLGIGCRALGKAYGRHENTVRKHIYSVPGLPRAGPLSEATREAIPKIYRLGRYTYAEMAEALGCSASLIASILRKTGRM